MLAEYAFMEGNILTEQFLVRIYSRISLASQSELAPYDYT